MANVGDLLRLQHRASLLKTWSETAAYGCFKEIAEETLAGAAESLRRGSKERFDYAQGYLDGVERLAQVVERAIYEERLAREKGGNGAAR